MNNTLYDLIYPRITGEKKKAINGWNCFNGECCINNGHRKKDIKKRAGITLTDETFGYHCFNCSFGTRWTTGTELNKNNRRLLEWYGYDKSEIAKIAFDLWRSKHNSELIIENKKEDIIDFKERPLPEDTYNILLLLETGYHEINFVNCVEYLDNRGFLNDLSKFYFCKKDPRKIIIPFYFDDKIVGHITRAIDDSAFLKYKKDVGQNYIYNNHLLTSDYKTVILVEGCLDALAINGISVLGNNMNETHIKWIKSSNKNIIVVPDRDEAGKKLIEVAKNNKWGVSYPIWEKDCKDAAEAAKRYGKFYTIYDILKNIYYDKDITLRWNHWLEGKT